MHENMPDRRFCFVLGAGASKPSGIPTAGELGLDWLKKLHTESGGIDSDFAEWLSKGTHGIEGLPAKTRITDITTIAAAYPAIYRAKWGHDPAQGHAEIERRIETAKPSYGYYALAEILASDDPASPSRHNVVITPNFDNLPAETLGALGKKIPIVIGHSAIADFARPTLRRPLIIKFHHDFLLSPKSDPNDVGNMDDSYSRALAEIFRLYTPIVVGYGGNDGSLMGLLESLPEKSIPGGILWCWRKGDPPSARIEAVVSKQAGTLIEISGFDELMTLLEGPFGHVFNPDKLSQRATERAQELTRAKELLAKKAESGISPAITFGGSGESSPSSSAAATASAESSALLDALNAVANSSGFTKLKKAAIMSWWHWQFRINLTSDLDEKERLFEEGLEATQNAPQLLGNYAVFLETQRKDDDKAEEYYLKALAADPNHAAHLGNYASFLETQRKDDDKAEEYYLKALAADPNHATLIGNYASFLETQREDNDKAEEYYLKALAADPNHATNLGNYANFLENQRKDAVRAEEYYQKALAANPNHVNNLGKYASFLETQRKDDDKAEEYYLKALDIDPNHATNLAKYASFLQMQRKKPDKAEEYYLKAVTAAPNRASILGNYAYFVQSLRNNDDKAQEYYQKALAVAPNHTNHLCNYAQFLIGRGKLSEAQDYAQRAWNQISEWNQMLTGEVAFSLWLLAAMEGKDETTALGRLKTLLEAGYSRYPWNFDAMLDYCAPQLPAEKGALARKLAAAILDESKLQELEGDPLWKKVEPLPLDPSWPSEGAEPQKLEKVRSQKAGQENFNI